LLQEEALRVSVSVYSELEGGSLPIDVFILARERHRQREEEEEEAPLLLMASSAASSLLVAVVVLVLVAAAEAAAANETSSSATAALRAGRELRRYRRVQALLRRVNKPAVRTIESPDGDLIDCVAAHLQPAFDHPKLQGQKPEVTEQSAVRRRRSRRRRPCSHRHGRTAASCALVPGEDGPGAADDEARRAEVKLRHPVRDEAAMRRRHRPPRLHQRRPRGQSVNSPV
jgi:hypothetical protein